MSAIPPRKRTRIRHVAISATNGTHALQQSSSSGSLTVFLQSAAPLSEHSAYVVRAVLGSRLMTHMHQERPSAARGLPQMETPAQYREFAAECYRLASVAKIDAHRKILREMARAWAKVAEEAEQTQTRS